MGKLFSGILNKFMKAEHAVGNQKGLWNGTWSDMMIETTYMKYGKGPSGMISTATKPRSMQTWANSHQIVNETLHNLVTFTESRARLISDQEDGAKLRKLMSTCTHPFNISVKELCTVETCTP